MLRFVWGTVNGKKNVAVRKPENLEKAYDKSMVNDAHLNQKKTNLVKENNKQKRFTF